MKRFRNLPWPYAAAGLYVVFLLVMLLLDIDFGQRLLHETGTFAVNMIVFIPCMFILIGLLDVWVPKEWIQKHIGDGSGLRGGFYVILLAMLQGGPLYGAFPTAYLLWKKGCSMRNIFLFLGAFSSLKIPMVVFEVKFLGWQFTLVRALVALPVFVVIAEIMVAYARRGGLQMIGPDREAE
jgi:uncharacterized membrane protein YraQ (UPF0718 family)